MGFAFKIYRLNYNLQLYILRYLYNHLRSVIIGDVGGIVSADEATVIAPPPIKQKSNKAGVGFIFIFC